MKYLKAESSSQEAAKGPHQDWGKNMEWARRILSKVVLTTSHQASSLKWDMNSMCVIFSWSEGSQRKTCPISFHQPQRTIMGDPGFKEQLCNILNYLGGKGLVKHKEKMRQSVPVQEEPERDDWSSLFGNKTAAAW